MPQTFVIFGASGDLTQRKLIPALYRLHRKKRLPAETRIVGFSRTAFSHAEWREQLASSTQKFVGSDFDLEGWRQFAEDVYYHAGDINDGRSFEELSAFLAELEGNAESRRVYYLSTAPRFYEPAIEQLGRHGLADERHGPRRVVIEKPFGVDFQSARALNAKVHECFAEQQVYRIDHYLGKETVQNLLVLRFANAIFEPIWNRNYIDHVQITVAEEVDIGGRAGYYDRSGVLRDMLQNHLLQLMMITAMEAPVQYQADPVRDEKVKVLQAVRTVTPDSIASDTLRGQYDGYLAADGVAEQSHTATFAAVKLWVDNWRWQGVPFYLRSGKAMSCRTTQIVIQFREPPHMLFREGPRRAQGANQLVIQVQPAEGIQLHFLTKVPDAGMRLRQTDLDFSFQREFRGAMPEAYERLLLDALRRRRQPLCPRRRGGSRLADRRPDCRVLAGQRPSVVHLRAGSLGTRGIDDLDARAGARVVRYLPRPYLIITGMFTGLVQHLAEIARLEREGPGVRLGVREPKLADCAVGASIAVDGCCLTVVGTGGDMLEFQAGEETLSRTTLGRRIAGDFVNLETSLTMGDEIGGHLVTGHIDGVATVDQRIDDGEWSEVWYRCSSELARQMSSKGSVAVDGVSLTLVEVEADRFSVALIPHTLAVTTLGQRQVGDAVNIETDLLAKYVQRQLEPIFPRLGPV